MAIQQQREHQYSRRSPAHCQRHRALHHCGGQDQFPTTGQTSVDSSSHRVRIAYWKVRMHGAFSIPRKTLGLRPNDESCHHESSSWISSTGAALNHSMMSMTDECSSEDVLQRVHHGHHKRRISEVMSDHFPLFVNVQPFARVCLHMQNLYIFTK